MNLCLPGAPEDQMGVVHKLGDWGLSLATYIKQALYYQLVLFCARLYLYMFVLFALYMLIAIFSLVLLLCFCRCDLTQISARTELCIV